ncbi:beta-lactamase family protein [Sphingomonas sp. KRR8]|uniref:serine hydrolase domain-containing protein n=1 Tax=Sphingomonas sp. KRR8 TaxID=2942996 RepID=UPI00202125CA|nr:serine hydrolase domain-containing protein [Sphingomonas sp. KRR8]URD60427.1 beta-lactamase family protein [Sphingomonas sp. KRR8]
MRRVLPILLLLALSACAAAGPRPQTLTAVAFDEQGIGGSLAEGIADPATGRSVTIGDPARVASLSKLVTTIGVMRLVEDGRLSLDGDVAPVLGVPLRYPLTLRMLLSHTSGLRDHDDQYAIPLGEHLGNVLADSLSWDSAHPPGTGYFTYSNLNFVVVGSLVERVTGERFDRYMRRAVLQPLKLDACFNWPTCPDAALARAIVLSQDGKVIRDDLHGHQPDCPVFVRADAPCDLNAWVPGDNGALFAPQGGLRISASGLAIIGQLLLGQGAVGGVRLLRPETVALMVTPAWRFDGSNGDTEQGLYCAYGLGVQLIGTRGPGCDDDLAGRPFAGHAGDAYGVRSGLWIDPARRTGVAYIATGLPEHPPKGRTSWPAPEERAFRRALALGR